ncbi:2-amino-4-hydroxy-6-hydroxymethyldihydropteridine diphosphokinase [Nakamurella aerolata]|uniref:2-amino-4-hydroxy-6-hydroxymethyldihydropteridine diphosphokinase n=1 Tax=Nakamurella aerolata TaxID=1656892 RepID=A0A849A2Z4_9ACTN|nr:2-amino-4-hydroxy-6-hydroxymethyldihydropteridine diphosphokinase [Nakamurella aerolata]NNG34979.1 2-amino-4-hydroxy-6-hydroxymethyldihydropteridine diphosphokinase [Nakamurella aerolata]
MVERTPHAGAAGAVGGPGAAEHAGSMAGGGPEPAGAGAESAGAGAESAAAVDVSSAVLSMGSNLGDRRRYLADAVAALGPAVRAVSSVYSTPPWAGSADIEQDDYLNIVVLADAVPAGTPANGAAGGVSEPMDWLRVCRQLETAAGRERGVRWGPRTLDVDVVAIGQLELDLPELTVPHPHAGERGFVLVPWAELDPGAELPGAGPIADLIAGLEAAGELEGIRKVGAL